MERNLPLMGSPSHPFTFDDLYKTIIIMISFWSLGKLTSKCGLPALCGEIISGIIVGPHLLDWAPKPDSLMMFGELGLMLLFLEAGLDIDMEMIRLVGKRGVLLSVLASTISLTVGTFFSYCWIFHESSPSRLGSLSRRPPWVLA